jgi:ABC-type polysaccharide/polyol phosphate transport system ATPase subunit
MSSIVLKNVGLEYPVYHGASRSLKKALLAKTTKGNLASDALQRVAVRALSGINLELKNGDRFALIGRNGAGKTTLLKVLAGIYEPSSGTIEISGHVSALLDSNVGLNPDATGYENIILRGMYMDAHPKEMKKRSDDIAEFTELGDYLSLPVRTYSAGMMIRLAFAISTCILPEILIMDEWLAAGDAHFLAKAHRRMEQYVQSSSILVLASHSLPLVQQWCTHGIYLEQGRVLAAGPIDDIIAAYEADVKAGAA